MIGWMLAQLVVSTQCCNFPTGEVWMGNLRNSNLKLADDNRLFHIRSDKPLAMLRWKAYLFINYF